MLGFIVSAIIILTVAIMLGGVAWYYWQRKKTLDAVPNTENHLLDMHLTLKHDLPNGTGRIYIEGKLYKVKAPGFLAAGDSVRITDFEQGVLLIQPNKFQNMALQTAEAS